MPRSKNQRFAPIHSRSIPADALESLRRATAYRAALNAPP